MSDPFEYAEQVMQDAIEEDAYYREKDREIEEAQKQNYPGYDVASGACNQCGRDAYLPPSMGGCYCA